VALAEKIDTLTGFFLIDEKPTGSKDPYALRRAALGVIRLIVENGLRMGLAEILERAAFLHGVEEAEAVANPKIEDLLAFFADRLKVHLRDQGARHDLVSAIFELGDEDDLVRLLARVEALKTFLASDDGANLLTAYKRASNIVRIEEKKDDCLYDGDPDPGLFTEKEEKDLHHSLGQVVAHAKAAARGEKFEEAMGALATLRGPVDAFFDTVTVNCDDEKIRRNRLRILSQIRAALHAVADFSKIEG
jgi:glycyl-tRNA synthetase beta chain